LSIKTKGTIFLCIGAPRCGTTWLHHALRQHPDIFLPPVKELRHFAGTRSATEHQSQAEQILQLNLSPPERLFAEKWQAYDSSDDQSFEDLFNSVSAHTAYVAMGEISPIYCTLGHQKVARLKRAVGADAKIIFLMRNPIERDISHLALLASNEARAVETLDDARGILSRPSFSKRSDYERTLRIWKEAFGEENLLVAFPEQIKEAPLDLIRRICEFLKVEFREKYFLQEQLSKKVNTRRKYMKALSFKDQLEAELASHYLEPLKSLAVCLPDTPVEKWLRKTERILRRQ